MNRDAIAAALEARLRALGPVSPEDEGWLHHTVEHLIRIGAIDPPGIKTFQRAHGRGAAGQYRSELAEFEAAAEKIEAAVDELSGPTINALARRGIVRAELRRYADRLRQLSALEVSADDIVATPGDREETRQARAVALILADAYEKIAGAAPTMRHAGSRPYGPFYRLVEGVLKDLRIRRSPENAVKQALRQRREFVSPKKW